MAPIWSTTQPDIAHKGRPSRWVCLMSTFLCLRSWAQTVRAGKSPDHENGISCQGGDPALSNQVVWILWMRDPPREGELTLSYARERLNNPLFIVLEFSSPRIPILFQNLWTTMMVNLPTSWSQKNVPAFLLTTSFLSLLSFTHALPLVPTSIPQHFEFPLPYCNSPLPTMWWPVCQALSPF